MRPTTAGELHYRRRRSEALRHPTPPLTATGWSSPVRRWSIHIVAPTVVARVRSLRWIRSSLRTRHRSVVAEHSSSAPPPPWAPPPGLGRRSGASHGRRPTPRGGERRRFERSPANRVLLCSHVGRGALRFAGGHRGDHQRGDRRVRRQFLPGRTRFHDSDGNVRLTSRSQCVRSNEPPVVSVSSRVAVSARTHPTWSRQWLHYPHGRRKSELSSTRTAAYTTSWCLPPRGGVHDRASEGARVRSWNGSEAA